MADVFDSATRSRLMSGVRRYGTAPERLLGDALTRLGVRFAVNEGRVRGTPDVCFRRLRLAVFVDGDFWHGRPWFEHHVAPATNRAFWVRKFGINRARDVAVTRALRRSGWSVVRLWASDVKQDPAACAWIVATRLRTVRRRRQAGILAASRRARRR